MFKKNVGPVDSAIRITVGIVALSAGVLLLGALQGAVIGLVAVAVGLIGLTTGTTRRCPTYVLLGITTVHDRVEKTQPRSAQA